MPQFLFHGNHSFPLLMVLVRRFIRVLSHHSGGANHQSENLISQDTGIGRLGTGPNETKPSSSGTRKVRWESFFFRDHEQHLPWICQGPAFPLVERTYQGMKATKLGDQDTQWESWWRELRVCIHPCLNYYYPWNQ